MERPRTDGSGQVVRPGEHIGGLGMAHFATPSLVDAPPSVDAAEQPTVDAGAQSAHLRTDLVQEDGVAQGDRLVAIDANGDVVALDMEAVLVEGIHMVPLSVFYE